MNDTLIFLIEAFVLLFFSAFFSVAETSLTMLGKIQLKHLRKQNKKDAKRIDWLLSSGNKFLSTILIGNNLANILLSSLTTAITMSLFGSSAIAIATGIITAFITIFGEITPKLLASKYPEKLACLCSRLLCLLQIILMPISWFITKITDGLAAFLLRNSSKKLPTITQEELESVISSTEKTMMTNVFDFSKETIKNCMTPIKEVCAVPLETSYEKLQNIFRTKPFSRLPVYKGSVYNIVGVIHYKDLLFWESEPQNVTCADIIKKMNYEPLKVLPTMKLFELRDLMRKSRNMVIVVNQQGKTLGIITMKDIIEEIFEIE